MNGLRNNMDISARPLSAAFQAVATELQTHAFDPFRGSTLERARLIWHPQVHKHFGEQCAFFLLRLQDQSTKTAKATLTDLLHQAGINTHSVYLLYGYFDVLIRVWATGPAHDRFTALLDENVGTVAAWDEFSVAEIRYAWDGEYLEKDARVIEAERDRITEVCSQILSGASPSVDVVGRLYQRGFIHALPQRPAGSLRFYVLLVPLPGTAMWKVRGLSRVIEKLNALRLTERVTVYSGMGFASHILSFFADNYEGIAELLPMIEEVARDLSMRTITLLIANNDVEEADCLGVQQGLPPELFALANILGEGAEEDLAERTGSERHELAEIFSRYRSLLGGPVDRLFLSLMRAGVTGDLTSFNRELSVVMHFEALLKRFVRQTVVSYGIDDVTVLQALTELGFADASRKGQTIELLPLGSITQLMQWLVESGTIPEREFEELLGSTWLDDLGSFTGTIRNPFAHGTTFTSEYADGFMTNWAKRAEVVCRIGVAYSRLLDLDEAKQARELAH